MARSPVFFDVPPSILFFFVILSSVEIGRTQNLTPSATTPPLEVAALNTIFQQWGISFPSEGGLWNISGNPCTGAAIDEITLDNNPVYNPGIKCDCSFDRGSTCRIIRLRVYQQNAKGLIPDELWTLTFLENLDLGRNLLTGPLSSSIGNLTRLQYLTFGINQLSGEIPKEIGKLTHLISLGLGTNNFSGSLPSEIGNLLNLEQLAPRCCSNDIEPVSELSSNRVTYTQCIWSIATMETPYALGRRLIRRLSRIRRLSTKPSSTLGA